MTKLLEHIEEMRARLSKIAADEQALVKAMGEALDRLDQQLLRDVRTIATEHETRREAILGELQGLAAGIGLFRAPIGPRVVHEELPSYVPQDQQQAISPGDWRRATSNIEDELEELDLHLNGRAASSH